MAIGTKKQHVQVRLDRNNVTAPYLSPEEVELYERDEYKYVIHLLKTQPNDEYRILQFLLLKFYPLIVKTAARYSKVLSLDWTELISFTRHAFIELVYRFNLSGTLYFKTYIPIALRRALYDYLLYEKRRHSLLAAVHLDSMEAPVKEAVVHEAQPLLDWDSSHPQAAMFASCKEEIRKFVESSPELVDRDRVIFFSLFYQGKSADATAQQLRTSAAEIRKSQQFTLEVVRDHLRDNFL